jgi:lactoylglutathione lyase
MLLQDNLEGIQHLAIFVTDRARSQAFYEQFGFKAVLVDEITEDGEVIKLAFMRFNELTLEIVELPGEKKTQVAGRVDGHYDHLALRVKDIDKAYAELTAKGFKTLEEHAPVSLPLWKNGSRHFTIRGPEGEKVEFSQIL